MPPFHPNAMVPVPAPTAPSATAPLVGRGDRRRDVIALHVHAADVVERAVVGLADERVDRADVLVAGPRERPSDDGVERRADGERVREDDRRFDRAELFDLRRSRQLAERVAHEDRARHLFPKQIAAVRQDGRHPGAHGFGADDGRVADGNPRDIGDGIERPGESRPGAMPRSRARGRSCEPAASPVAATRIRVDPRRRMPSPREGAVWTSDLPRFFVPFVFFVCFVPFVLKVRCLHVPGFSP